MDFNFLKNNSCFLDCAIGYQGPNALCLVDIQTMEGVVSKNVIAEVKTATLYQDVLKVLVRLKE